MGTLAAALTGASAVSALGMDKAQAATNDPGAASGYVPMAEKGAAYGVATLDPSSKVPMGQLPDLSSTFVSKRDLSINARDYGAIGDGQADDTNALKAWLAAGGVALTDGTYRITSGLTLAGDNRQLLMRNARIIADTQDIIVLTVQGANARLTVHIDGNNKANYGIKIAAAGALVESSIIENIYSTTSTARGIEVTTGGGCTIRQNIIRNVKATGDTVLGNNNGASRGIVLTNNAASTSESLITGNTIENITGEEGDAIQILFYDGTASNPPADVTISDNEISNVSRRFIKVQASDVRIINNTLGRGGTQSAYPANSIDVMRCNSITISDNRISPNALGMAINLVGTDGAPAAGAIIKNNVIRQDDSKNYVSIFLNYVSDSVAASNTIFGGGTAIAIGNSNALLVQSNAHHGGVSTAPSFSANTTNTGIVMRLNVNMNKARTVCVTNTGPGALTEMNSSRT